MVTKNKRCSKRSWSSKSFVGMSYEDLLGIQSELCMGFHISFISDVA